MVLIAIRHGQSVWNAENRFTGWEDVELSDQGIKEAITAGKLLSQYNISHGFMSCLKRATKTFELIINEQPSKICNYYDSTDALMERDYGDLTGKNKKQIEIEYGKEKLHQWRRSYNISPPNGENLAKVCERVGKFYEENIKKHVNDNKDVLIVAHGNTIRALFVYLELYNSESVEQLEIPTGTPLSVDVNHKTYSYINPYQLVAYQILDSRGQPSIEVKCYNRMNKKCVGIGSTPSGASCGSNEVSELRDNDENIYLGKSVFRAINNIHNSNSNMLLDNSTCKSLKHIDDQLEKLDVSESKSDIGGNATTAMSFCMADVAANLSNQELYEYIGHHYANGKNTFSLPTPLVNIINGGKHGVTGDLKIQEFMIFPREDIAVTQQNRMVYEIYHTLKKILVNKYGPMAKSIGDEGGFCPPIYTAKEALDVIIEAIKDTGAVPGKDIFIALDCAASEFYDEVTKKYEVESNLFLSGEELVNYYGNLIEEYPALKSIEDGFHETDYESWISFTKAYGDKIMIVGDDLFTTNTKLIQQGLEHSWANTLLLKVNQIGTISKAIEGAQCMFDKGNNVIVSHRSGETNHAYLIDIAVGIGAKYVKIGSPCRGERVAKFNRIVEIDQHIRYKN